MQSDWILWRQVNPRLRENFSVHVNVDNWSAATTSYSMWAPDHLSLFSAPYLLLQCSSCHHHNVYCCKTLHLPKVKQNTEYCQEANREKRCSCYDMIQGTIADEAVLSYFLCWGSRFSIYLHNMISSTNPSWNVKYAYSDLKQSSYVQSNLGMDAFSQKRTALQIQITRLHIVQGLGVDLQNLWEWPLSAASWISLLADWEQSLADRTWSLHSTLCQVFTQDQDLWTGHKEWWVLCCALDIANEVPLSS